MRKKGIGENTTMMTESREFVIAECLRVLDTIEKNKDVITELEILQYYDDTSKNLLLRLNAFNDEQPSIKEVLELSERIDSLIEQISEYNDMSQM